MRLVLALLLTALPCFAEPQLAPAGPASDPTAHPAIGRVYRQERAFAGFCSGALVAPNLVLTAGHCAGAYTTKNIEDAPFFIAGLNNTTEVARRRIIAQHPHPGYRALGYHSPDFDMGLWVLDAPITEIEPLPLAPIEGEVFALLGYHRALPFHLTGYSDCPALAQTRTRLTLGCRVISGNSGSPVMRNGPDGWTVVAVTSSQDGPNAIAAPVGPWVHEAIRRLSVPVRTD